MSGVLTSNSSPLRIDTIILPGNRGQIGMTLCPGKKDLGISGTTWDRDLKTDLEVISAWRADAVVTLLEDLEFEMLGITTLPAHLLSRGIEWHHLPIRDRYS